jgi:hypothetical protein
MATQAIGATDALVRGVTLPQLSGELLEAKATTPSARRS